MPTEIIQTNLPQHNSPVILDRYKPKTQKRPGTIAEWTEFVVRLAQLAEELHKDARIILAKRREIAEARPGSMAQREAERSVAAMLKRVSEHSGYLANALLATGMSREHLENHLQQCGAENEAVPEYRIALLYSKLMGLPFREERITTTQTDEGQTKVERLVEEKTLTWARELKPADVQDFYRTTRFAAEVIPPLAAKFKRGEVRV